MTEVAPVEFELLIRLPGQDLTNIVSVGTISATDVSDGVEINKAELAAHLRNVANKIDPATADEGY